MAYRSWKDIADITFNSTDLKAFVKGVSGIKQNVGLQNWTAAGSAWQTNTDTGQRSQDPIVVEFMYDGTATGPNVKCALATSSTLTITFFTGESITGTFIVSDVEVVVGPDQDNELNVTFTPTGVVTLDLTT